MLRGLKHFSYEERLSELGEEKALGLGLELGGLCCLFHPNHSMIPLFCN